MKPTVVDLSHWNSPTDFKLAKASGIQGIIHKATEGTWYKDPKYNSSRAKAAEAGILWGAYHFFRPGNVDAQVDYFLAFAKPDEHTLLCLDHEDAKCSVADVERFLRRLEEKTGRKGVLYSGHVIKEQLGSRKNEYLGSHRLWIAQYGPTAVVQPSWTKPWLWQYSDKGAVPGLGSPVDVNDYAGTDLAEEWAGTGVVAEPVPPVEPIPIPSGQVNLIAFGGLYGDAFSAGLKTVLLRAEKINGVDFCEYYPYTSAEPVMQTIAGWRDPTIVVSHSWGVNNFLKAMRKVKRLVIPLAITLDSSQYWPGGGPGRVPANITRVINYYEQTWWPLAIRGEPLYRPDGSSTGIENNRVYVLHASVDDYPPVQERIITEVRREIGQ